MPLSTCFFISRFFPYFLKKNSSYWFPFSTLRSRIVSLKTSVFSWNWADRILRKWLLKFNYFYLFVRCFFSLRKSPFALCHFNAHAHAASDKFSRNRVYLIDKMSINQLSSLYSVALIGWPLAILADSDSDILLDAISSFNLDDVAANVELFSCLACSNCRKRKISFCDSLPST